MIIFLYGPDDYRRHQKLKEILAGYNKKHAGLNFKNFDLSAQDGEDGVVNELKDFLGSQSLFDDFKLTIVGNLSSTVENKDLIKLIKGFGEDKKSLLIILEADKPSRELNFLLKEPVKRQEFKELKGSDFRGFLRKEAIGRALKFSPGAENLLVGVFEPNTWALVNELDKISLAGFKQPIEIADIKSLSDFALKEKIFDLVKILAARQPLKTKLSSLENLFLQKEAAPHIFNLLAAIAPGSMVENLANYDASIKSGGLDYEEALLDLVIS